MPTTGIVSGRVFIWYPHDSIDADGDEDSHIGHASMYIGNYEIGKNFEQALDPESPHYVAPSALMLNFGLRGIHYNDNYVSWWAGGEDGAGPLTPKTIKDTMNGLYADCDAEDSEPHVVYDVYGLDVTKMRTKWRETRDKPGAHYHLYRKNCSDIVMRVLRAGGALSKLNFVKQAWYGNIALTTPKKVAQLCNELRDAGWAIKDKAGHCPSKKGNKLAVVFGLR